MTKLNWKKYSRHALLCCVSGCLLTACNDNSEVYDIDGIAYERVYFSEPARVEEGTVVKTPVGMVVSVKGLFSLLATKKASKDVHVRLSVNNGLIEDYNKAHGTHFVAAPTEALQLSTNELTIEANAATSKDTLAITVPTDRANLLLNKEGYLVPVEITACDVDDFQPSKNLSVRYLHIASTESVVNDNATKLEGKPATAEEANAQWTCMAVNGGALDPNEFKSLFNGGWNAGWNFTEKKATTTFVVDLGSEKALTGFHLGSECVANTLLEVSTDNAQWLTIGNTNEHKSVNIKTERNNQAWFALYGSIPARYVKVTLNLDANFWGWQYVDWGYCKINSFNLSFSDKS